ncbi:triose-phosphate isomerase [Psychrobacter aestuarii]|uniref:Triosephosphate isomerase n=1 Tax=Psychrobacter aestuarii TaxID=556327 RepID=A0ABN0W2X5_9GAMM|nr:triose-phosphate isomerase [Psychrobacter aestuarii]
MQAWVIGNWKQNPATQHAVNALVNDLKQTDRTCLAPSCRLMVAPSTIHIAGVSAQLQGSGILCAAQDISAHSASTGAYTGDISAAQAFDAGARWSILGHSERREYHQEDHETLVQKTQNALSEQLGVIFCIGESQQQYDDKQTLEVLSTQLDVIADVVRRLDDPTILSTQLIVAYEPVWAIGTGKVPTVDEVSATHTHIKHTLAGYHNALANTAVLYGGSVNAGNAADFAASRVIDGALVGGASLKAESFMTIAQAFAAAKA